MSYKQTLVFFDIDFIKYCIWESILFHSKQAFIYLPVQLSDVKLKHIMNKAKSADSCDHPHGEYFHEPYNNCICQAIFLTLGPLNSKWLHGQVGHISEKLHKVYRLAFNVVKM